MAEWLRWEMQGCELYRWAIEDDVLYRVHISTNERELLAQNAQIRAHGMRKMTWARPVFRMTRAVRGRLEKENPALKSPDAREQEKAWEKLARDPDYSGIVIGRP